MASLMEQAKGFAAAKPPPAPAGPEEGGETASFNRPDLRPLIPKGQEDAVARIAAAGMKIMYSPEAREDVKKALQVENVAQSLAMNVTGLILTLDKKSQGGLPVEAIFPAAMELLGEAAEVFTAAGKPVSQSDYADAARLMMVLLAKKMGATDEQIMGEVAKHVPGQGGGEPAEEEAGDGLEMEGEQA